MKNNTHFLLLGQFVMAAGVLLFIFNKESDTIFFISGLLIGLSLVFNIAFYLRTMKAK